MRYCQGVPGVVYICTIELDIVKTHSSRVEQLEIRVLSYHFLPFMKGGKPCLAVFTALYGVWSVPAGSGRECIGY